MIRPMLITVLSLAALSAQAEVIATQKVEKEVAVRDANGFEEIKRVKAEKVLPGEQVIYSLQYRNTSSAPAEGMVLVMPVPKEILFQEGSIGGAPANVTFSADGGETYVARGRLTVREDGAERPATSAEITHVRWTLTAPVIANGEGEVSYRGVLR